MIKAVTGRSPARIRRLGDGGLMQAMFHLDDIDAVRGLLDRRVWCCPFGLNIYLAASTADGERFLSDLLDSSRFLTTRLHYPRHCVTVSPFLPREAFGGAAGLIDSSRWIGLPFHDGEAALYTAMPMPSSYSQD
jgi:hypothetical protein